MKKVIRKIFIIITICISLCSCDDETNYTCGYCGREMEWYYDYIDGEYTCYSCHKALRNK